MENNNGVFISKDVMEVAQCECGSLHFEMKNVLWCYKGMLTRGQGVINPAPVWLCVVCGHDLPMDEKGYPVNTIRAKDLKQMP